MKNYSLKLRFRIILFLNLKEIINGKNNLKVIIYLIPIHNNHLVINLRTAETFTNKLMISLTK